MHCYSGLPGPCDANRVPAQFLLLPSAEAGGASVCHLLLLSDHARVGEKTKSTRHGSSYATEERAESHRVSPTLSLWVEKTAC